MGAMDSGSPSPNGRFGCTKARSWRPLARSCASSIRDLVRSEDSDENAIRRGAEEQGDLRAEVILLRAQVRHDRKRLLNDDWLTQLGGLRPGKHERGQGF